MARSEEINKAIAAHSLWKVRLRQALETGSSEFTIDKVKTDNQCDFGKWLYSLPVAERQSADWKTVQQLHSKFHAEAGNILDLALKGKKKEFEDAMMLGKDFAKLSSGLTTAMMTWSKK